MPVHFSRTLSGSRYLLVIQEILSELAGYATEDVEEVDDSLADTVTEAKRTSSSCFILNGFTTTGSNGLPFCSGENEHEQHTHFQPQEQNSTRKYELLNMLQMGAITKRMTAIEEMAGMDVLCSDKTGTLTLNKLTVDKNLIEVFAKGYDRDLVVLIAAKASRLENQDAIDAAIMSMLPDIKKARAGIQEVHFLPFNPTNKRTALT